MTRQRLIRTIEIALSLFVTSNILVAFGTRHSPEKRKLISIRNAVERDCIAFGNSLIEVAFVPDVFDMETARNGHKLTSVNAGLWATYPVEHLILLKEALRVSPHPRFIIYGFYDFQLTTEPKTKADDLFGNRSLGLFLEPKIAQRLYKMPIDSRIEVQLLGNLPLFADRGGFYFRVSELRESLKGLGKARPLAGASTRFAELEANSIDDFNRDCLRQVAEKTPLTESVLEMIREAKVHGAQIVFTEMPLSLEHVRRFYGSAGWPVYRDYVLSLLQQQHVEFLDSSEWLTEQPSFIDEIHLSRSGSEGFTRKLARELLLLNR
jgi:hypothetical protein